MAVCRETDRRDYTERENYEAAERADKNCGKISELQARNREIDSQITELENTDIIGLVRSHGLTPEKLAELIRKMQGKPLPTLTNTEETKE